MKPAEDSVMMSPAPTRLAEIRALEQEDLLEVAELFELGLGSGVRAASPALVDFFRRTLFENPWADPDLKSLVALDERARPIGFIGAEARRLRFGDRTVRAVWGAHLVVEPAARHLGVGAVLLRRMLKGAQDVTLTETGSETIRQIWETLGGDFLHLEGIYWMRVFRPWRVAVRLPVVRQRPRLRAALWPLAVALDAATVAGAKRYLEPDPVDDSAVPLTPRSLLDFLPTVTKHLTAYPDYDEAYLNWLFGELGKVERRGRLVARLVHDRSGRPLGSYVYYLRPGWRSEVLQVAARKRDIGRVFDHLLWHAYRHGSISVGGHLEPAIVAAVRRQNCLLWHRGGAMVHARNPELLGAIRSADSLVTRLEGGWYLDALAADGFRPGPAHARASRSKGSVTSTAGFVIDHAASPLNTGTAG